MAAPNLLRITVATGKTTPAVISSSASAILSNPTSSGKVYKINALFVANVNGDNPAAVTVSFVRTPGIYRIASTVEIAADSSLVVIGKDTGLYLEEGDSITCQATIDNYLTGVISYEIMG